MIDSHNLRLNIHLVDYPVTADSDSIYTFCTAKLSMFGSQRIFDKGFYSFDYL